MKHPAKFDHSEDPADLVFNQSNLKTVFSIRMKTILPRMTFSLKILDPKAPKADTERRGLLGSFWKGQRRS